MSIKENILNIRDRVPPEVELICVSKTKPVEDILQAYNLGERNFGENKVQELIDKIDKCPNDIKWHLIGNLQSNKVKYLVGKVHLIQSVSSEKLLKKIQEEYSKKNLIADVLIQVNIGREETKGGFLEEELFSAIELAKECKNVKVHGLMTIIPKGTYESNKIYFNKTKIVFEKLKEIEYNNIKMDILSMGMSKDFEVAIEEGSTMIRVGQGIFGER